MARKSEIDALVKAAKEVLDFNFGCGCCGDAYPTPKGALKEALAPFGKKEADR